LPFCTKCGAEVSEGSKFCSSCGAAVGLEVAVGFGSDMVIATTPTIPGYRVKKVLQIVFGCTVRTRGVGGQIMAGFQSMVGGEVTAFTSEIEKARIEAIERMKNVARERGANAIIGLDMETSNVLEGIVLISATGTAVIIEPEQQSK